MRYLCCLQTLSAKHGAFVKIATGYKHGKQMYWFSMEQLVLVLSLGKLPINMQLQNVASREQLNFT